ncbi:response regulator transcription factor [Desulfuribacillus alkaliarsenatis]|uniref:DNA-binding response regulator n=1 Tax=Desulfuribacillus alkaliarsenatis TaxID=766136 RepID=A0A1E5G135_9FIRM|nr:response regulator transcription factor [Desulfuribacillus alkaliarsenatis]OEF96534.1 hypothetical protein BHF68_07735 [Desulfuribacillus alkaliarsenatis]
MHKIVIIEDEQGIRNMVEEYLKQQFYHVFACEDGLSGLKAILEIDPDLIILDIMLPELNGLEVCKEVRKYDKYYPIIMLTAKSQKYDIIVGLEIGADDYIVKPFSLEELEARIRAMLRRHTKLQSKHTENDTALVRQKEQIIKEPFLLDLAKHELYKNNISIRLTPTEFQLFMLMFKNPGRVYTRLQLLDLALGEEYQGYERSIDTHIRNLRQKIEDDSAEPKFIVTVHGIGYKYNEN